VENAVRHGDREPMRIEVRATRGRHGVELRVRDHGRGYAGDPIQLGHLFERGDASRGTGVGLYLVRVLMERMGGSVEFANAEGGGFCVTLTFATDS
jgi:two-component system osmolarity sensor histidine kinase EnvZ